MRMTSYTMSPTDVSDVAQERPSVETREDSVGSVPDVQSNEVLIQHGTVYHKVSDSGLPSLASLETQPTLHYSSTLPHSQSIDHPYELDKKSTFSPLYNVPYPYENEPYVQGSADPTNLVHHSSLDSQSSQNANLVKSSQEEPEKFHPDPQDPSAQQQTDPVNSYLNPVYCPEGLVKPQNKVVAVNPVILVDKVERSLIVQWYENSVKREQRISYKKYGNAKAQQRAEGLISKLLAGSTFDQLYPEKGPPILTIFENVGKHMVSLTRDRIIREWRVDWLNNNGSKMRARWSCKKVGNEEARKRAEAFAYSLIQGTFNPRLLHKATGTRLSKNDMKYNAVVSGLDSQIESKAINQLSESNWQGTDASTKRRTKKRSVKNSEQKKGKTRKRGASTYADVNVSTSMGTQSLNSNMISSSNLQNSSLSSTTIQANLTNPMAPTSTGNGDMSHYMKSHCYPYMNMVQDPSFSANPNNFYPMYQEDCESSNSVNQQMDPNSTYATSMMHQGWMDWSNNNNMQKMMPFNQEWDYSTNSQMVEFPFYSQQSNSNVNTANGSIPTNLPWDPLNTYTNMAMYIQQNELQTGREYEDQGDTRLTNQYYGYYGNEQGFPFQDNMLSQEQMMMGGYYNYPNTMRMDPNSQWTDENKEFPGEYQKEYSERTKQEEMQSDNDLSQVTTLANYKNITGTNLTSNELPPQNLSVSTRMYTADHYGYINTDLADGKQDDPSLNCFTGELEDPLIQSQTMSSQLSQPMSSKKEYPMYQKDKFAENYDNITYREMEDPVKYYSM